MTNRPRKITNCIDLLRIGAYSFFDNNMAQDFNGSTGEVVFFCVELDIFLDRSVFRRNVKMLSERGRKNNNVINITKTGLPFLATKDGINHALNGSGSVA